MRRVEGVMEGHRQSNRAQRSAGVPAYPDMVSKCMPDFDASPATDQLQEPQSAGELILCNVMRVEL